MKAVRPVHASLIRADLVPSKSPPAAPTRHHGRDAGALLSFREVRAQVLGILHRPHPQPQHPRRLPRGRCGASPSGARGGGIMLDRVEPVPEETSLDEIERIHI